ncbi:MAG: Ig-like domain-containing protein [Pseudomonadota bacterium]
MPLIRFLSLSILVTAFTFSAGLAEPYRWGPDTPGPLAGHLTPLPKNARWQESPDSRTELEINVVLRRSDEAGYLKYLQALYTGNRDKRPPFLSPTEQSERFGPNQDAQETVANYLGAHELQHVHTGLAGQLLTFVGTQAAVERAFGVRIDHFQGGSKRLLANDREPTLPAHVAPHVLAIIGLSSPQTPRGITREHLPLLNACSAAAVVFGVIPGFIILAVYVGFACTIAQLQLDPGGASSYCFLFGLWPPLAAICTGFGLATSAPIPKAGAAVSRGGNATPPLPNMATGLAPHNPPLAVAGFPNDPASAGGWPTGAGQTVGITSFTGFTPQDVADWLALMQIGEERMDQLTRVPVNGGAPITADETEILLDVAAVWSVAPDAAIRVYEAPFSGAGVSFQALFSAMIDDGVDIISNSFAYCESDTYAADVASIDAILQTAAVAGISVFSASGDRGSTCLNGRPDTVHVPSSSPHLTAVGGTTLSFGPGFTYGGETWWDGSADTPPSGQGGFGESAFFPRPAYQDGLSPSLQRSIPDVTVNADPATGYFLCQENDGGCPTGKLYGGTSVGAPIWAGFTALLNERQGSNLGFLNPQLYPLAATQAFHDASELGSDFARVGLGSPNLDSLYRLLNSITLGAPDPDRSELGLAGTAVNGMSQPPLLGLPADGDTAAIVVATLRDSAGHTMSGRPVTLSADVGTAVIEPPTPLMTDDNGQAVFSVTSLDPTTYTLTLTDETSGTVLTAQPLLEYSVPPAVSAGINAFPVTLNADGVSETVITVTLRDALDRPTPGKEIRLDQAGGRSVITGPEPPVTDSQGQIEFRATSVISETVRYTASIVPDFDRAVPGAIEVTFGNGIGGCASDEPSGVNGYQVTPFATGFDVGPLFFGNINQGNCNGGALPVFVGQRALIADSRSGRLFEFPASGGAAIKSLSNLGPTLATEVRGLDGRVYVRRLATTGDFTTGAIFEINPDDGSIRRTVAAPLTCPHGLVVDPLSGDLFFNNVCSGAGSANAAIFRIRDPAGPAPVVENYATLPRTPNGRMAFAPDGTLYAVSGYTDPQPAVVRISGSNGPTPHTVETVDGIYSFFWLTILGADENGQATSLGILQEDGINIVALDADMSQEAIAEGLGPGLVGPDGCLYSTLQHTVYRIADPNGDCPFFPSLADPFLMLEAPELVQQGEAASFNAILRNASVAGGQPVTLAINGVNTGFQMQRTDPDGRVTFTLQGRNSGTDTLVARTQLDGLDVVSNPVTVSWEPGRETSYVNLSVAQLTALAGVDTSFSASLLNLTEAPPVPVSGVEITINLGNQVCAATTDTQGLGSCLLTPTQVGDLALIAEFAGNASLAPDTDETLFRVLDPAGPDLLFRDGFEALLR